MLVYPQAITKDTTDEEILKPIALLRQDVQRRVEDTRAVDVSTSLNQLARAEGEAFIEAGYRNALAADATVLGCVHEVARLGLMDNDDTWSGRSNDTRRAYADGRREKARDIINHLLYSSDPEQDARTLWALLAEIVDALHFMDPDAGKQPLIAKALTTLREKKYGDLNVETMPNVPKEDR